MAKNSENYAIYSKVLKKMGIWPGGTNL